MTKTSKVKMEDRLDEKDMRLFLKEARGIDNVGVDKLGNDYAIFFGPVFAQSFIGQAILEDVDLDNYDLAFLPHYSLNDRPLLCVGPQ